MTIENQIPQLDAFEDLDSAWLAVEETIGRQAELPTDWRIRPITVLGGRSLIEEWNREQGFHRQTVINLAHSAMHIDF